MIIVKFSGGLGNQIFQYGLYWELQKRYPDITVLGDTFTYVYQDAHYGFELDRIFHLTEKGLINTATRRDYYCATGTLAPTKLAPVGSFREKLLAYTNARLREYHYRTGKKAGIQEEPDGLEITDEVRKERWPQLLEKLNMLDLRQDWYIDGYWQSTIFFEQSLQNVIDNLVFPDITDEMNRKLADLIRNSESVSIHVRRGDYVGTYFDVVGMDYYEKAVENIRGKLKQVGKKPTYFVFSDDPEYVSKHFSWLGEYRLIDNNKGLDSYRDLQLMCMCKHQITANSSFSIWGGYLNRNPGKIVYYPEWYTKSVKNAEKEEPGWVRI